MTPGVVVTAGVDAPSFATVYAHEHDGLVRLAALILGSASAAEDVVQETFAKLLVRFDRVDNPAGWLRVAVVNGCLNERRRLGVVRRYRHQQQQRDPYAVLDEPAELVEFVARLPIRQRTAVVLRYYEDLPEAEIARLMGVRLGTVKSTLHRALARLREEVGE